MAKELNELEKNEVFPAYAGMNGEYPASRTRLLSISRMRRDDWFDVIVTQDKIMCFPHTPGWLVNRNMDD